MAAFNLTAQLNITGPNNLKPVISNLRKQLSSVGGNVNIQINPNVAAAANGLNGSLKTLNTTLKDIKSSASSASAAFTQLGSALRSVNIKSVPKDIAAVTQQSEKLQNQQVKTAAAVSQSADSMVEFGKQSALAIRRFAAFTLVTGVIFKFTNALGQASDEFMKFNRQLVQLSQVTGTSLQGLAGLQDTITKLSTSLGVSSSSLIDVSSTLAQAGLSAAETEQALQALAKSVLAPSFGDLNQTVEGSIALMRQFSLSTAQLESALGSINSVAAKFAVEADDIIVAIQRTGGVFAAASKGVVEGSEALNQFISIFTSVRATTRESAETIATGLRTIFTRIQRTETIDLLKKYGIQLTDLEGKFVGPYEAVKRLSRGLAGLDTRDIRFSAIIEELGGFRQVGKVIPLLQQFSVAEKALMTAQRGQGSLTADAAKAQQALAIQMAKVQEEFIALVRSIGSSNQFQTMVKVALDLASALISVADASKHALPAIAGLLAVKGTIGAFRFASGFASGMRRGGGGGGGQGTRMSGAPRGFATGGEVNNVPVALMPGEAVIFPRDASRIGSSVLRRMNYADKHMAQKKASGGKIGIVPGSGNTDSFYTTLPAGSFVIRKAATEAMGAGYINDVVGGRQKFEKGGTAKKKNKKAKQPTALPSSGPTEFTHITTSISKIPKKLQDFATKSGLGDIRRLYTNMGLDLPKKWNRNWAIREKDNYGAFSSALSSFVGAKDVFKTLKASGKIYRFTGRGRSEAARILGNNDIEIRKILSSKLRGNRFFDTDPDVELVLPALLKQSVETVLGKDSIEAAALMKGFQEISAYKLEGQLGRKKINRDMRKVLPKNKKQYGGDIQKLAQAGPVEARTSGIQESILADIRRLGGIAGIKQILKIPSGDRRPNQILRSPIQDRYMQEALQYVTRAKTQQTDIAERNRKDIKKSKKLGFLFAAAGVLGSRFAPIKKTLGDGVLQSPRDVYITSGLLSARGAKIIEDNLDRFNRSATRRTAKKLMVDSILAEAENGRMINLDFDKTLAFGADKITGNTTGPKFAEFSDPDKVKAGLSKAKLSMLGKSLVAAVREKPDILKQLRVLTARPSSTLGLVQAWLAQEGLPINNLVGVGGAGVSESAIAKLKAQQLQPNSVFVDDNRQNIRAARKLSKANKSGITTYRYGLNNVKSDQNAEGTIKGIHFERIIEALGGPKANKAFKGIDFPTGLKGAAKYFGLSPTVPTDAKRTLSGPSVVEDNVVSYLKAKGYASGGEVPHSSLTRSSKDKRLDPQKLAAFLGAKTTATDKQKQLAKLLGDTTSSEPAKLNYDELLKGYAIGGEIPIMAQAGEFVINKHAAGQIGHSNLKKLNRGGKVAVQTLEKLPKYHSGGSVQKLAVGGKVGAALDAMSPRDAAKLRNTITSNAKAFEKLEQGIKNWPVEAIQAAMKKMARAIENGEKNFEFNPKTYNQNNPSQRTSAKERVGPSGGLGGTSASKTRSGNFEANRAKTVQDLQDYETQKYQEARKAGKTSKEAREYSRSKAIEKATTLATPMSQKEEKLISVQAYGRARESGASKAAATLAGVNALRAERDRRKAQTQGAAIFGKARMTGQKPQDVLANAPNGYNRSSQSQRDIRKQTRRNEARNNSIDRAVMGFGHGALSGVATGAAIGGFMAGPLGAAAGSAIGGVGGALAGSIDERANRIQAQKYESASIKLGAKASNMAEGGSSGSAIVASLGKAFSPVVSGASKVASGMAKLHTGAAALAGGLSKASSGAGSFVSAIRTDPTKAFKQALGSAFGSIMKLAQGADSAVGSLMGMKKVDIGGGKQGWRTTGNGIMGRVGNFFGRGRNNQQDDNEDNMPDGQGGKKKGKGSGGSGMGMYMAEMALSMAGSAGVEHLAKAYGGDKSKAGRQVSTIGGSAVSGASMGMMMGSAFGPLGMAAGALIGGGLGAAYGYSQMPEVERQAASQKRAQSIEESRGKFSQDLSIASDTRAPEKTRKEAEARAQANFDKMYSTTAEENLSGSKGVKGLLGGVSPAKSIDERIESARPAADSAKELLMQKMNKTGKTLEELQASMPASEFNKFAESIALTDKSYQKLIEQVNEDGEITEAETKQLERARQASMEREAADLKAAGEAAKAAKENAKLSQAMRKATVSFEKMADALSNAASRADKVMANGQMSIDAVDNPMSAVQAGQVSKSVDILSNPGAYSIDEVEKAARQNASMAGSSSEAMVQSAVLPRKLEQSFGAAMTEAKSGNKSDSEARSSVKDAMMKTVEQAFGPDIASGMREDIDKFVNEFKGDITQIDFNDMIKAVPELADKMAASGKVMEALQKQAQSASNAIAMMGDAATKSAGKGQEMRNMDADTFSTVANSSLAFKRATGEKISWQADAGVRTQARAIRLGTTANVAASPQAMLNRYNQLQASTQQASEQQKQVNEANRSGMLGGDQASMQAMQQAADTTAQFAQATKQARDEIMSLPSDIKENISGIMQELQDVMQERAAKLAAAGGFMEKVLTSTPQDLKKMGNTFNNLSRTLSGKGVSFQESYSANTAYNQVRRQGGNHSQAQRAAQDAYAQETGDTLSMAKELAPLLGAVDPTAQSQMMGSVYESMFAARGMDTSQMKIGDKSMKDYIEMMKKGPGEDPKVKALQDALAGQQAALQKANDAAKELIAQEAQALTQETNRVILDAMTQGAEAVKKAMIEAQSAGITAPGEAGKNKPDDPGKPPMNEEQIAKRKAENDAEIKRQKEIASTATDPVDQQDAQNEIKSRQQENSVLSGKLVVNSMNYKEHGLADESEEQFNARKEKLYGMVNGVPANKPQPPTATPTQAAAANTASMPTPQTSAVPPSTSQDFSSTEEPDWGSAGPEPEQAKPIPATNNAAATSAATPSTQTSATPPSTYGSTNKNPITGQTVTTDPAQANAQSYQSLKTEQQVSSGIGDAATSAVGIKNVEAAQSGGTGGSSASSSRPGPMGLNNVHKEAYIRGMSVEEVNTERKNQYLSRFNEKTRKSVAKKMGVTLGKDGLIETAPRSMEEAAQRPGSSSVPESVPRQPTGSVTPPSSAGAPVSAPRQVQSGTGQQNQGTGVLSNNGFEAFANKLDTLLTKLADVNIPTEIRLTSENLGVTVTLNGGEVMANLPDQLKQSILSQAAEQLANYDRATTGEGTARNPGVIGGGSTG